MPDILETHQIALAKVAAGEAVGFVCTATHCKRCDETNWGQRMGCRCNGSFDDHTIEWGFFVKWPGSAPQAPAPFATLEAVRTRGLPLLDLYTGEPIPLPPVELTTLVADTPESTAVATS